MTKTLTDVASWEPIALSLHYFSAHFAEQLVQVLDGGGGSDEQTVTWAVGVLSDGDWESLGAWPGPARGTTFWREVWDDVDSRGVDKISWVSASDPYARALSPDSRVLPPFRQVLCQRCVPPGSVIGVFRTEARRLVREASGVRAARVALERLLAKVDPGRASVLSPDWPEVLEQLRPFYALRPHRRAVVRTGDECLEQLELYVRRAVGRHGPFADLQTAAQFVGWTLWRNQMRVRFPNWPAHWAFPLSSHGAKHAHSGLRAAAHVASPGA